MNVSQKELGDSDDVIMMMAVIPSTVVAVVMKMVSVGGEKE